MPQPEERPRLRWRILAWGIAVLILVPVLYVAAAGPFFWWAFYRPVEDRWYKNYESSLQPLQQWPPLAKILDDYCDWWVKRTPPRTWPRAYYSHHVKETKTRIQELTKLTADEEEENRSRIFLASRVSLLLTGAALGNVAAIPELPLLDKRLLRLERRKAVRGPTYADELRATRQSLHEAEQMLRQFDAH